MAKLTTLDLLSRASNSEITKKQAERLHEAADELMVALESMIESASGFEEAEGRDEIAEARELLETDAYTLQVELASWLTPTAEDDTDDK